MNVVIFGATGGTGRELVKQSLAKSYIVTAFVRDLAKLDIRSVNLKAAVGNATDYSAVARAIKNQDAVLCALGASNSLKHAPALIEGVRNIVRAMKQNKLKRLVYLSVLGVGESRQQLSLFVRYIVVPLILSKVVADHEAKENIIKQSDLDWTIVRPPRLTNGRHTGTYRHGEHIKANSIIPASISRADVTEFMISQLTDDCYLRKMPAIMY